MPTGSPKRTPIAKRNSSTTGTGRKGKKRKTTATGDEQESNQSSPPPSYNLRQRDSAKKRYTEPDWGEIEQEVEGEVEIHSATPDPDSDQAYTPPPARSARAVSPRTKETQALLPKQLKESLKRVKNILKLPKARRWAYCEFFIADIDRVLLQPGEDFFYCLREAFPDLGTRHLRRSEWHQVRRLIGKPRRYSPAFLENERVDLEKKRRRIRDIQKGASLTLDDEIEIPAKIPQPLIVGQRVFGRVRFPKDGIYAGTVDAVMDGRYRIIFDKDVVMPLIVPDYELMSESSEDLVSISFFMEQNKVAHPMRTDFLMTCEKLLASDEISSLLREDMEKGGIAVPPGEKPMKEERIGNYPIRLVVILIKLSKLLEKKKSMLADLHEFNGEAERTHMRLEYFPRDFQEKYAKAVSEMELINKEIDSYLIGIGEYMGMILPHLTEVSVISRPEALQKFCHIHAAQICKATNITTTNVQNKKSFSLVTGLASLMLQIRALGEQNCSAYEFNALKDSMEEIKEGLDEENRSIFEDHVEINIKHVEFYMKGYHSIASMPREKKEDRQEKEVEIEEAEVDAATTSAADLGQ